MDDKRPGEHPRFLPGQVGAIQIALPCGRVAIATDRLSLQGHGEPVEQGMLGRHDHEGHAVERVGPRGVHEEHVARDTLRKTALRTGLLPGLEALDPRSVSSRRERGDEEIHLGSGAPPDPITL